ncbi:MAG: hypothetical protein PHW02_08700 [bacterium]|nr:hypothetical protein [bacterium]
MKKFLLFISTVSISFALFAGPGGFIDFVTTKPANTTSYIGTFGVAFFYDIPKIADVKGLTLRPSASLGMGGGTVEERIALIQRESGIFYSVLMPDISLLYYLYELKEPYSKGFLFYVGAGAQMTFKFEQFSNDDWFDDKFSNSFPFPALRIGMDYKKNLLFEISISSPSMLSFGVRF